MTENIARIAKYNFWDGKMPDLGIRRAAYLRQVNGFLGNKLVKVIVGQRRAGKSYLLRQIIAALVEGGTKPVNILYINKEFIDFDFLVEWGDLENLVREYRSGLEPSGRIYLFIDEIQDIKGWERFVSSASQSYVDDYELFITGSNSQLLAGELASLLSGRYIQFQIQPYTFEEFLLAKSLEPSKATYLDFIQTGGLPELFHLPDQETRRHYVSAIRDTVLLRDIIQRYNIKDARLLEDLFLFLVNNASNLISVSSIVNFFAAKNRKTNYETVSNYLRYMENTFLIHKVDRFNIRGKETLSGSCKYYINDLAFRNYLYPGFESGFGYRLENAVFLQLIYSGFTVYTGSLRNKEVDFVAQKGERRVYIQCSWSLTDPATIEREYASLQAIRDGYEKIVVSMDDLPLGSNEGIRHLQAWRLEEI